ncbi:hypothetical protein KAR91_47140 [Candidatus Pacearchaeota archaeon]|nr:hypothetical protein [Candidatus Pacearchaeota archaeon]
MARKSLVEKVRSAFPTVVNSLISQGMLIGDKFLIKDKELDGEPVVVFDVGRFRSLGSLSGATEKIAKHVEDLLGFFATEEQCQEKWNSWGSPTHVYYRQSVSIKTGGIYTGIDFENLVTRWNRHEGDHKKVAADFGVNKWGEYIMPPSSVTNNIKGIREVLGDNFTVGGQKVDLYKSAEDVREFTAAMALKLMQELNGTE